MVFQSYALYPHMSVYNNMAFALQIKTYDMPQLDANGQPVLGVDQKKISKLESEIKEINTEIANIEKYGFTNVCILSETGTLFEGITLYKTPCQHGRKEIVKPMCEKMGMPYDAMGIVFKNSAEKTLYVAGDTIWCEEVKHTLDTYKPQVVLINACGASLLVGNGERLIMHKQDIEDLASYIPQAQIIASHMDTVSHLTVTRQDIRSLGLSNVHVPEDNEVLSF
jgi:ABC-type sugar transport system ATPase subunit